MSPRHAIAALSARDRRALRLGAWVLLPALVFAFVVRPLQATWTQAREALAAERALLARERALLADTATATPSGSADAQHWSALRARLIAGGDDVMAASALAAHLGTLAAAHDVWLQSASTLPIATDSSGLRVLRVDVRAESDLTGVLRLLDAVARGGPLVRVESMVLMPVPGSPLADGLEPLTMAATFAAFAAPEASAADAAMPLTSPFAGDDEPMPGEGVASPRRAIARVDVARAVSLNLFSPDRRAPALRYRLAQGDVGYPDPEPMPPSLPALHGTAVDVGGRSFAMCSLDGAPAVVVRVGDTLGAWTVVAIARGRVTLRDADGQDQVIETPLPPDGVTP